MQPGFKTGKILFVSGLVMAVSEFWKQLTLCFYLNGGNYVWWYFPFQLCSVPMYICLLLPFIRKGKLRLAMLAFLADFGLLAGIMAFADTSGFRDHGYLPLTVHSYLWHLLMIGTGLFSCHILNEKRASGIKLYAGALTIYLLCCAAAEGLNLALNRFGTINLFYINPHYEMQQIFFRDLVPFISNNGAIAFYIILTAAGAGVVQYVRDRHFARRP